MHFIDFVYFWCIETSHATIRHESDVVSMETSTDWARFCRGICIDTLASTKNGMICGPGAVVEVDESKFGKIKFNKGRRVEGAGFLGA
jgi:hypothetical protein